MVIFNENVKEKLVKGVELISDAVGTTFGPNGRNTIIKKGSRVHITKDGATVAENVNHDDEAIQAGISVVRDIAMKTAKDVGDGPQPYYSNVLHCEKGMTPIRNINIGDIIYTPDFKKQAVIGKISVGKKAIGRITFSDNSYAESTLDHLWIFNVDNDKVSTTINNIIKNDIDYSRYFFKREFYREYKRDELYECLGEVLFYNKYQKEDLLDMFKDDTDIINIFFEDFQSLPLIHNLSNLDRDKIKSFLSPILMQAKLEFDYSLFFKIEICLDLFRVLGYNVNIIQQKNNFILDINTNKVYIKNIEVLDYEVDCYCIKVSSDEHLYLTNCIIPTHNTTTATLLSNAIVQIYKDSDMNPILIQRELSKYSDEVIERLNSIKVEDLSSEDIFKVATLSANNDKKLGKLISDIYNTIGKYGIISLEDSSGIEDYYKIDIGMKLETGYISPFFINTEKDTVELENVYVHWSETKIKDFKSIASVAETCNRENKSLLLIAPDIDSVVQNTLLLNKNNMPSCCIKSPSHGVFRDFLIHDFNNIIGESHLCTKVIIDKDNTVLMNDKHVYKGDEPQKILEKISNKDISEIEFIFHQKRLANYSGGICTLFVGGYSEVEIKEKKDRLDDAICATKAALNGGIVPGGGRALEYCSFKFRDDKLKEVLTTPIKTLYNNAGLKYDDYKHSKTKIWNGYDIINNKYKNLREVGVVDPFLVTATAFQNAVNAASMILTNGCLILNNKNNSL